MTFTIAIAGKPNVGKSSLFNKLNGRRLAIVDDTPGVTRDSKESIAEISGHEMKLIDTAGWEKATSEISEKMLNQTDKALMRSNFILFVVDGRQGITNADQQFANIIRKSGIPTIVVVNKSESKLNLIENDLYRFGFGEPLYVSSAHGHGINELIQILVSEKLKHNLNEDNDLSEETIKLTIVGRPNVGKSTLFNAILGFERSITSDLPGTTRDSINYFLVYKGKNFEIIDTAGLRKRANINERIEELSTVESINAIRRANITILVISSEHPLEKQDLAIARISIQEGKPLVLVVNKSDLIKDYKAFEQEVNYLVGENLSEVAGLSIIYASALHSKGIDQIFNCIFITEQKWKSKISTPDLNRWLKSATDKYIPPLANSGRRIRIKYATQIKTKPPTFSFYSNIPEDLPESYNKYLRNSLRREFGLEGIPIRMLFNKNKNPYKK